MGTREQMMGWIRCKISANSADGLCYRPAPSLKVFEGKAVCCIVLGKGFEGGGTCMYCIGDWDGRRSFLLYEVYCDGIYPSFILGG